jgi:C4-dicarboxylate transporter DctM subunit
MNLDVLGLIAILLLTLALGEPLYVIMGSVALYCLVIFGGQGLDVLATAMIGETRGLADNPVLLAIPFFVLAGGLMTEGTIAQRLIQVARSIFGWMPGGMAVAAVSACVFFAAISGSSPVTVIAIGSIMYPALVKEGYPDRFANGLVTSAGSLGILIPPSIPMIVYAIVDPTRFADPPGYNLGSGEGSSGVSDLFLAGVGPGLFIAAIFAVYSVFIGIKHKTPRLPFKLSEAVHALRQGFWSLMLPVLILGGIYSGAFSPTQAAAVSVVYAFVVELWIHRSIKLEDLPRILADSSVLMGTLFVIMALALGFNRYLELAQIPEAAVELIKSWDLSMVSFLLIVNVLLLIVGCLMDIISAILILVPLLATIGFSLGVHPIHLAIIFIVNLEIGYLTPPVGLNLFVSSSIFQKKLGDVIAAVVPFIALMIGALTVITYVPTISIGPVSALKGKGFIVHFPDAELIKKQQEEEGQQEHQGGNELEELMDDGEGEKKPSSGNELEDLMDEVEAEQDKKPAQEAPKKKSSGNELEDLMDEVEAEQKEKQAP